MLTTDLASNFRSLMERAGLNFQVDCPPLREPAYVDRDMWERIVLNLISNAFKFTFDGSVKVALEGNGGMAELTVSDTGTGIPQNEQSRIFERFHRIEGAMGRTFEGSGIGLALVRDLIGLHGGSISVESEVGRGSKFIVSIPFGTEHLPKDQIVSDETLLSPIVHAQEFTEEAMQWLAEDTASAYASPGSAPDVTLPNDGGEKKRVLVADDNADMRHYIRRVLAPHYHVRLAINGEEALAQALADPPDLILADVMMPRMNGFEMIEKLRAVEVTSTIPIIVLSARAGEESRIEGLEKGADDYLIKPFSAVELQARVRTHLSLAQVRERAMEAIRSANQQLEARIGERTRELHQSEQLQAALTDSLAERDTLLKEVHHRVKNNLQVITSLLELQASQAGDPRVFELFQETCNRVASISAMHELAYRSGSFAKTGLVPYAAQLVQQLVHFYRAEERIEFAVTGGIVSLELERAIPFGLMLNELVSNVCKHAFPDGKTGMVTVRVAKGKRNITLDVADTGVGLPKHLHYPTASSLGLQLVRELARQLGAKVSFRSARGTVVRISIPRRAKLKTLERR